MRNSIKTHRISFTIVVLGLAFATIGGTCVVVEEGPPGAFDGPGENEEVMLEQEREVPQE